MKIPYALLPSLYMLQISTLYVWLVFPIYLKGTFIRDTEAVFMHRQQSFNETFVNTTRLDLELLMKGAAYICGM